MTREPHPQHVPRCSMAAGCSFERDTDKPLSRYRCGLVVGSCTCSRLPCVAVRSQAVNTRNTPTVASMAIQDSAHIARAHPRLNFDRTENPLFFSEYILTRGTDALCCAQLHGASLCVSFSDSDFQISHPLKNAISQAALDCIVRLGGSGGGFRSTALHPTPPCASTHR